MSKLAYLYPLFDSQLENVTSMYFHVFWPPTHLAHRTLALSPFSNGPSLFEGQLFPFLLSLIVSNLPFPISATFDSADGPFGFCELFISVFFLFVTPFHLSLWTLVL